MLSLDVHTFLCGESLDFSELHRRETFYVNCKGKWRCLSVPVE